MRQFRFGVNFYGPDSVDGWVEHCQVAERLGYDAVHAPDHLGSAAPFAMLAAAAVASERLRLATYVINNGFWNPHLLAREATTVDRLSDGRLELGLGLGYVKREFDDAGIPWESHAERVARLERSIDALDRLFADDGQPPSPVQRPRPPLMLGGHGERLLTLAARRADIVAFGGVRQRPGATRGTLELADLDEIADRVELVRRVAGGRLASLEFGALFQYVAITDDAQQHAAGLVEQFGGTGVGTADEVLRNPFLLVGTVDEIAAELIANRERFGFSYLVTHQPYRDALGQVIPRVRELASE
jgi:probable F420-dependent oxidoreductase